MPRIDTIGYGGKRPEAFYAEVEALNPGVIVDVRQDPDHAFLGVYTRRQLEKRYGSLYLWVPELGNKTRELPPSLVDEEAGLRRLEELTRIHDRILLLCAEKNEENCHRSYVKRKLLERL